MAFLNLVERLIKFVKKEEFNLDYRIKIIDLIDITSRRAVMLIRAYWRQFGIGISVGFPGFFGPMVKIYHGRQVKIGRGATLGRLVSIDGLSKNGVIIGHNFNLGDFSIIKCTGSLSELGEGITIGDNVGIGAYSYLGGSGGIQIGDNCIMGVRISFHSENHNFGDDEAPIRYQGTNRKGIMLGDNCWIGANVTFLDGVRLGSGCVVGAGSIVNSEFPDNSIIVGSPARSIRKR